MREKAQGSERESEGVKDRYIESDGVREGGVRE